MCLEVYALVGFLDQPRGKGRVVLSSKVDDLCEVRIISIPVTTYSGMPRLPRKKMLDNIFIIAFLLLALSSSRADGMCSLASLVVT